MKLPSASESLFLASFGLFSETNDKCAMRDEQWMREILARRREEGTFRELRTPEQDQCFVDFTSNDYLGLGRAADLRQASELEAGRARQVTGAGAQPRIAAAVCMHGVECSPCANTIAALAHAES